MSGSIARRAVLCILVITLLLPVASAHAAPARQSGERTAVTGIADWSRALFRTVDNLLGYLRPATANADTPPGQKPGEGSGREGNGIDPHGKPGGK